MNMGEETRVFARDLVFEEVNSGRAVRLFDQFTIGREDCHWTILNDPSISRRHLRVHVNAGKVLIEDLGTKNRTRLNGKPMVSGMKYLLNSGDEVEIGNHKLVFRSEATSPLGSGPKARDLPSADGIELPSNIEITPPRLPMVERPGANDAPLYFEAEEPPPLPPSDLPFKEGTGQIPELEMNAEMEMKKVDVAPPVPTIEAASLAAKSVDLIMPPPLLKSGHTTSPPINMLKQSAPEPRHMRQTDGLTDFIRMKRYPKHQWTVIALSLLYPLWLYIEDALLTFNVNGLPHSIFELTTKWIIALSIAFPMSFFPNWWVHQKNFRPFILKVSTPISGILFLALSLWICDHNGYTGSSLRNQVMAYCTTQFQLEKCRALVLSPDHALAGIPPATQNEIRQRLATESQNRAPASLPVAEQGLGQNNSASESPPSAPPPENPQ